MLYITSRFTVVSHGVKAKRQYAINVISELFTCSTAQKFTDTVTKPS